MFLVALALAVLDAKAIEPLTSYYYFSEYSSTLDQAEIVIIGESHQMSRDQKMMIRILETYARPGDILLMEGADRSKPLNSVEPNSADLKQASSQMLVGGWDDENAFERMRFKYGILEYAKHPDSGFAAKAVVPFSFIYIIATYWRDWVPRNLSMREAIRQLSIQAPGKKIFVMTGQNHIDDHDELIPFLNSLKRHYAVLVPDDKNPLRIEDSALEYRKRTFGF